MERSTGAVVAGPELICRGFVEDGGGPLLEEAEARVLETLAHLAPDAGWAVWKGAVHEALSSFLFKRTKRRPLILPIVTEV